MARPLPAGPVRVRFGNVPAAVSVVSEDVIQAPGRRNTNLEEALRTVPGLVMGWVPTISADSAPITATPPKVPARCWLLTSVRRVWIAEGIWIVNSPNIDSASATAKCLQYDIM